MSESEDGLAAGKVQAPHGGIERGEQLVLHQHARVREPVEQRRLARVRVADERDVRDVAALARLALRGAGGREADEVALELLHAAQQAPAVDLELRFTRTAGADARTLLAELETAAAQAREPVAELRELDLHRTFLTRRVLGEDVEDQRDPIDDVDREHLLEIALLRGRELVVEDHDVDVEALRDGLQLFGLALADVGRGVGSAAALQLGVHGLGARGVGEQRELVERRLGFFDRRGAVRRSDEQRPLAHDPEIDLGRGQAPALATLMRARRVGHEVFCTG